MPAPAVRSRSERSCTRTVQPRCAKAQAAVRPAKPAPTISACRVFIALWSPLQSEIGLPYSVVISDLGRWARQRDLAVFQHGGKFGERERFRDVLLDQ